jgi:hypothetical protein
MKKLLLFFVLLLAGIPNGHAQTLYALLVLDQAEKENNLGRISQADEKQINDVIQTLVFGIKYKIQKEYIMGGTVGPDGLREKIRSLQVGPQDILFFYYSGQGYYPDAKSKFPTLKLEESNMLSVLPSSIRSIWEDKPVSLDEVGELLKKKGGRLNIVMADCRNTTVKVPVIPPPRGTSIDAGSSRNIMEKLMKAECGVIKVASARNDEPVWAAAPVSGSLFTMNFKNSFDALFTPETKIKGVSWNTLLRSTRNELNDVLGKVNKKQYPVWEIDTKSCQ